MHLGGGPCVTTSSGQLGAEGGLLSWAGADRTATSTLRGGLQGRLNEAERVAMRGRLRVRRGTGGSVRTDILLTQISDGHG